MPFSNRRTECNPKEAVVCYEYVRLCLKGDKSPKRNAMAAAGYSNKAEAELFDIPMTMIEVVNYEQLHNVDCGRYIGVVLDESSILKGIDSKTRKVCGDMFRHTPYRLSCTATPSPNDFMELGTQAEFLGIMSQVEMLAMFFVHDGADTAKWRLKGHGKRKFFEWLATWAVFITKPSDLGYKDKGHELPELIFHEHIIESGITDGLFAPIASGLLERNAARKDTVDARVEEAATIANGMKGQCLIWCHRNDESEKLTTAIDGAVQVTGSANIAARPRIQAQRTISRW